MSSKQGPISTQSTQFYAQSIEMHPAFIQITQKLTSLKQQSKYIGQIFEQFKEQTMHEMNKSLGKLSSLIQRELTTNAQLREELSIVKYSNQTMKKQVVQLREMIEEFVKSYNTEIETKDAQIKELKMQLGIYIENSPNETNHNGQIFLPEEQIQNIRKSLEVIQEVSEYTASCVQSIREASIPNSAKNTSVSMYSNKSNYTQTQGQEEPQQEKRKKKKSFLNFFRKNVDESVVIQSQEKQKLKQSHSNSLQDLHLGDTDKINIPKSIKSPKHMQILKKSAKRFVTEQDKENNCVELKATPHRRNNSYSESQQKQKSEGRSQKQSRSSSKAGSKQKIKLASKIMEQGHNFNKAKGRVSVAVRPSVHLGGKMHLKKLAKQIRTALQQYKVWEGTRVRQVKYEGEKKNGMRWGKGKLLYDNGFEYTGNFVQNYKHGIGTISLNEIVFYQGQWSLDEISGQGYIKSLKNYSQNCPKYLSQASYCGQLLQNKPHGMGTLFINQNQKFVTKFVHGVPVGQFTYYNLTQIQFGSWF